MKTVFFTCIITIFLALNICKAQNQRIFSSKEKQQISICDLKDTMIHLSDMKKIIENGCNRVVYSDAGGKELKLSSYLFLMFLQEGKAILLMSKLPVTSLPNLLLSS